MNISRGTQRRLKINFLNIYGNIHYMVEIKLITIILGLCQRNIVGEKKRTI